MIVGEARAAIETRGLRKQFGGTLAVADLSLEIRRGEIFGFLGPNGAGKTTAVNMLLGLVPPTSGEAFVLGRPLGERQARKRIGFLPEHCRFHESLTAREFLRAHGRSSGGSSSSWSSCICRTRPTGGSQPSAKACCNAPGWRKR
jgi:ABC-2 type transport system ATP-binding protein